MDRDQRAMFGPLIRGARKLNGLDQETLAEMVGVTRRTIGSIERGDTVPQPRVLKKLLQVLSLEPVPSDPDVQQFVALIEPLLQTVPAARRPALVQTIMEAVVAELRTGQIIPIPLSAAPSSVPDAVAADEQEQSIAGEAEESDTP